MNRKKSTLLFLVLILAVIPLSKTFAQESILSELSYLYLNKLIAVAKENHPRLKVFDREISAAKSDLSGVKASWLEPFSFQYVTRSNQQPNTTPVNITTSDVLSGYQFGVSINPGSLLQKPSQVRKAKDQVRIAQLNQEEYNLTIEAEVKRRYFIYLQYKQSLLPATNAFLDAQSSFDALKLKYQKSEITFEQYNSASSALNQAIQNKIQAEVNLLTSKANLEELTVKKLEEIN